MIGPLALRLEHQLPLAAADLLAFLAARAVRGVEVPVRGPDGTLTGYRRSLDLSHAPGTATLTPAGDHVQCELGLGDARDEVEAVARLRRLLDLDADPEAVDRHLGGDPLLAPLVAARPGLRVPGAVDGFEVAVRAVVGQQVSVAGAVTIIGRLAAERGTPLPHPDGDLTHLFPTAAQLAEVDPDRLPMPRARGRALVGLARAVAGGAIDLDPGADPDRTRAALLALPGIGPWTVEDIALRALADPDAFPASDLGVRRTLTRLAGPDAARPAAVAARAEGWRPWRAYATVHLWSATP